MRSLIILKGLVKSEKIGWVKKEKLENYLIDINVLRKLYANPSLIVPGREVLDKSFGDIVYKRFIEILCTKMGKGNLIVVDPENENLGTLEILGLIYGYKIFYVIQNTPKDYVENYKRYCIPYYSIKRKSDIEKEVANFNNQSLDKVININHFQDVLKYWSGEIKSQIKTIKNTDKILHVSDLHSNYDLFQQLPSFSDYKQIICYGDYIDGPLNGGSRKLTDYILKSKKKNIIWLEGNHELRLRRWVGYLMLKGNNRKELQDFLYNSLPSDFINTTALEYKFDNNEAKQYLEKLNNKLKPFSILITKTNKYISTHAGIKYFEQLDPRYIGSVIYGNRDMTKFDKGFSDYNKNNDIWSIHAHCKYPDSWEVCRYPKVVNLDPLNESEVVIGEQTNNNWNICVLKK